VNPHEIRIIGDPVLRTIGDPVDNVDGALVQLVDNMFETMYEAAGIGLAAPQVGVQKQFFVYDHGDEVGVILNPKIVESDGEWVFEEGCLSVPGLSWEITRPKTIHLVGIDLEGNEISKEADEIEARLFQHEIDHLNGVLLIDHLDDEQRKEALGTLRKMNFQRTNPSPAPGGLRLP